MVFVDKTLDEMLEEINCSRDDVIEMRYQTRIQEKDANSDYLAFIGENLEDREGEVLCDLMFLLSEDRSNMSTLRHMVDNVVERAYGLAPGAIYLVRYYFGEMGFVIQVEDFGQGFDSVEVIAAVKDERREQGVHFKRYGVGLDRLNLPWYEANIESSSEGTIVTFMYKYGFGAKLAESTGRIIYNDAVKIASGK